MGMIIDVLALFGAYKLIKKYNLGTKLLVPSDLAVLIAKSIRENPDDWISDRSNIANLKNHCSVDIGFGVFDVKVDTSTTSSGNNRVDGYRFTNRPIHFSPASKICVWRAYQKWRKNENAQNMRIIKDKFKSF